MEAKSKYWKRYWDKIGSENCSDHEADRGNRCICPVVEQYYNDYFKACLDPNPDDIVFDAGCGTGVNIGRFSPFVREMVGVDVSEEMIARAKKRIEIDNLSGVNLIIGNISNLSIRSGTFDKVICTSVLQYLNDKECEEALKELFRIAAKDGIVILHVKNLSSLYGYSLYILKTIVAPIIKKSVTPDHYRTLDWYKRTISKLGAGIVELKSFGAFNISHLPRTGHQVVAEIGNEDTQRQISE